MTARPWMLADLTYQMVKGAPPEVAVLPFGATEPHNFHLPYATDTIEAELVGSIVCERAHQRGAQVVCLPSIPYGTESNLAGFPLAMNLQPSTTLAILRDLVDSLEQSGIRKCLVLNSHGGNAFKGHLRELFGRTSVHLFLCNWYAICRDRYTEVFSQPDDHAGEMETSVVLYARPDLVQMEVADPAIPSPSRFKGVRDGHIEITRPWRKLTTSSGVGDPRAATSEKGKRWLEIVTEPIADFLVELAASPIDDSFPFQPKTTSPVA